MTEPVSPIKCILILLDGVADCAHVQLGHQTSLQAAHTPNPNQLAALGVNGLYHTERGTMETEKASKSFRTEMRNIVIRTADGSTIRG